MELPLRRLRNRTGSVLGPILWLFLASANLAGERLPVEFFNSRNGLPHDAVFDIRRDSTGYLWICTPVGLTRFDGRSFQTFPIPAGSAREFLETRSGRRLVATSTGLLLFDPEGHPGKSGKRPMFTALGKPGDPLSLYLNHLFEDSRGTIWGSSTRGLIRIRESNGAWTGTVIDPREDRSKGTPSVVQIREDKYGTLWTSSVQSLVRIWPDGRLEFFTCDGIFDRPTALVALGDGRLLGGDKGKLVELHPSAKPGVPPVCRTWDMARWGIESGRMPFLTVTSDGHAWASVGRELVEAWEDERKGEWQLRAYGEAEGLPGSQIHDAGEDAGGDLWLGFRTGSACKVQRRGMRTYGAADGLKILVVTKFHSDARGNLYAAGVDDSTRRVIASWDGLRFKSAVPRMPRNVSALAGVETLLDSRGHWWIYKYGALLRYPATGRIEDLERLEPRIFTTRDGVPAGQTRTLFEDSTGKVWISGGAGSQKGVSVWEPGTGRLRRVSLKQNWNGEAVNTLAEPRPGELWAGTETGIWRLRDGKWQTVGNAAARRLLFDRRGRLWVATQRHGLLRSDNPFEESPRFRSYTHAKGLLTDTTWSVEEDLSGRIYLASTSGLDRIDPETDRITSFTVGDGLPESEITWVRRDRRGDMWLATGRGAVRMTPQPDIRAEAPPVRIHEVRVSGTPEPVSALGRTALTLRTLKSSENSLTFGFAGLSFGSSRPLRYQYKLEGADSGFSAAVTESAVHFANLAPGDYRFLVRSVTPQGALSHPATVRFVVPPPFWWRWWFLVGAAALLSTLLYAAHWYRLQRWLALERLRLRIASDLHDDVGASLTRIAILGERAIQSVDGAAPEGKELIERMTASVSEVVDSMSDIVWAINPRRDTLADLLSRIRRYASDTLATRGIELEFRDSVVDTDRSLNAEVRRDLYLILKESIHNAARHSGATRVQVSVERSNDSLAFRVADNGRGLDPATIVPGNGVPSMRARAQRMGAELELISSGGLTVTLKVPPPARSYMNMRGNPRPGRVI